MDLRRPDWSNLFEPLSPPLGHTGTATFLEDAMNRDQIKGRMKDMGGKIQEKAGKVTGNRSQQAKGLVNQGVGKVQKTVGDAANEIDKSDRDDRASNR